METITIITATYNRAQLLKRLFLSLKDQTCKDFCWLIIDDGSNDNTREQVAAFLRDADFSIQYIKRKNGGKHRALNQGIAEVKTVLSFIVDSDDFLPPVAVSTILEYHKKYQKHEDLCGYSFLRRYENGEVNAAYFPIDERISTYREERINGEIEGDKAEVFFTDVLKRYPFPEFQGEKFLPEDIVWMQMSGPYRMVHINRCIYISEYLEGGLTKTGRRMKVKSPKGMMLRSRIYLEDEKVKFKIKMKMILLYIIYGKCANISRGDMMQNITMKWLFRIAYGPAVVIYYLKFASYLK